MFEILICDLYCTLASDRTKAARASMLVFNKDSGHWLSCNCSSELIERLVEEARSRGFFAAALPCPDRVPLRTRLLNALYGYRQRRIGKALLAHRAARPAVNEVAGLAGLYVNAGRQLTEVALNARATIFEIRRAERFSKFVRLSAHYALLSRVQAASQ